MFDIYGRSLKIKERSTIYFRLLLNKKWTKDRTIQMSGGRGNCRQVPHAQQHVATSQGLKNHRHQSRQVVVHLNALAGEEEETCAIPLLAYFMTTYLCEGRYVRGLIQQVTGTADFFYGHTAGQRQRVETNARIPSLSTSTRDNNLNGVRGSVYFRHHKPNTFSRFSRAEETRNKGFSSGILMKLESSRGLGGKVHQQRYQKTEPSEK